MLHNLGARPNQIIFAHNIIIAHRSVYEQIIKAVGVIKHVYSKQSSSTMCHDCTSEAGGQAAALLLRCAKPYDAWGLVGAHACALQARAAGRM